MTKYTFEITLEQEYKEWHRRQMTIKVEVEAYNENDARDAAEEKAVEETRADPNRYTDFTETIDSDNDYEPTVGDVNLIEEEETY